MDIYDCEKTNAALKLPDKLAKGKQSGETNGWILSEDEKNIS